MPTLNFIDASGKTHSVEAEVGENVMEAAIRQLVPGIVAECGGACSCATCHVYVNGEWAARLEKASEMEGDMLDFAVEPRESSRLSCQIKVTEEMDGMVIEVPERQH